MQIVYTANLIRAGARSSQRPMIPWLAYKNFVQTGTPGRTTVIGNKNGAKLVTVPNGSYVMKVSVLKALGDDNNPADWETWTSPAFTITR